MSRGRGAFKQSRQLDPKMRQLSLSLRELSSVQWELSNGVAFSFRERAPLTCHLCSDAITFDQDERVARDLDAEHVCQRLAL